MNETANFPSPQKEPFQAEVAQVLDIVVHSLYTHREIFVRELISNAADALEKIRYEKVHNEAIADPEAPLEIRVEVDESNHRLTFTDTGIGMTDDEIRRNLGTIAHSGTREFLKRAREAPGQEVQLIGQFGVGFYSAFMVSREITVRSRSFRPGAEGVEWKSDGGGEYTVEPKEGLRRGTQIILDLREDAHEFASAAAVKDIVKKYSNFVSFPIWINGERINTIQALWTRNKSKIKDEEYTEFYKFIANSVDEPFYRLHFSLDAPLQVHALLFVPQDNFEQYGFGRMEPGVNLYCRKVVIQNHSDVILPEWLRFLRGVVDSEDLPLNISRETLQDNALVRKLSKVITTRFLKFLHEQMQADRERYTQFWTNFCPFFKEAILGDPARDYRAELVPLLLFDSSKPDDGRRVSLPEYVSRMKSGQKSIYYINGPSREAIESGPYIEAFRQRDIEVLYVFDSIDDFVLTTLHEYESHPFQSADQGELDLPDVPAAQEETPSAEDRLNRDEVDSLAGYMKRILGHRVDAVRASKRLVDSPVMIVHLDSPMTGAMQRVLETVNKDFVNMAKKSLEFNPDHPILVHLARRLAREKDSELLKLAVEQLYDNALAGAGMMKDPRAMVQRNYAVLERALKTEENSTS
ncbi:MAG: molecular chaperone HtpG [bacterium]